MSSIIWVIKLPGIELMGEMSRIYWQLEFPLIIALETNEWHFQRAILKSFNMSPHMTMLGHLSHKLYTVVVGQPVFSILSWGVLLRLFVIVPFITTLINEVWPKTAFFHFSQKLGAWNFYFVFKNKKIVTF